MRSKLEGNLAGATMNHVLKLVGLFLFAFSASWANAQTTATVMPSSPRYMEPVYVRIASVAGMGINADGAQVSMEGNVITVTYQYIIDIGTYPYDVMLGRLPAGTYTVNVVRSGGVVATTQFAVAAAQVAQPGTAIPPVNYTDMWWNPAESGWGMSIHQGPTNLLFAVWFVYDASGKPVWYTLEPGQWTTAGFNSTYAGTVYKTSGPYFGATFDPSMVRQSQAGTATLYFKDASQIGRAHV